MTPVTNLLNIDNDFDIDIDIDFDNDNVPRRSIARLARRHAGRSTLPYPS